MSVILETTLGDIVIDLFTDERPRGWTDVVKFGELERARSCISFCRFNELIVIDTVFVVCFSACLNFLKLCKIKYYNYCLFHSVQVTKVLSYNLFLFVGSELL